MLPPSTLSPGEPAVSLPSTPWDAIGSNGPTFLQLTDKVVGDLLQLVFGDGEHAVHALDLADVVLRDLGQHLFCALDASFSAMAVHLSHIPCKAFGGLPLLLIAGGSTPRNNTKKKNTTRSRKISRNHESRTHSGLRSAEYRKGGRYR